MGSGDHPGPGQSSLGVGAGGVPGPRGALAWGESLLAGAAIAAMVAIPILELLSRKVFRRPLVPGAAGYVEHLTLWAAFLGAIIAARHGRHLALSTATFLRRGPARFAAEIVGAAAAITVCAVLGWGAIGHIENERTFTDILGGGLPRWVASIIMPVGYAAVALTLWWRAPGGWKGRGLTL
ncbi:MAG: TRAP transporter small permease, partial [Planctomycetota bacterium]